MGLAAKYIAIRGMSVFELFSDCEAVDQSCDRYVFDSIYLIKTVNKVCF